MKIGLISDIHGDAEALEKALDRLEHAHRVDETICAGDLVGRGPAPERVIQLVQELQIPVVQGNHDGWAYGLSPACRGYLNGLPLDWRAEYAGVRVFMTHGKPGNNMWGLYPEHVSSEIVDLMLASLAADVLVTGHTHMPMEIRGRQCRIVNPGSLYLFNSRRPSSHTYGVLTLPEVRFEVFDLLGSAEHPLKL
jgi:putative phosphoesterase